MAHHQKAVAAAVALAAGLLLVTGYPVFDPIIAGAIAIWIIFTTGREVLESHDELIWPEKIICCHTNHDQPVATPQSN